MVIISNPRNHAEALTAVGDSNIEAAGQFSYWPGPLGLAATRDLDLIAEFSQIASKEFRATGSVNSYGYSADVCHRSTLG